MPTCSSSALASFIVSLDSGGAYQSTSYEYGSPFITSGAWSRSIQKSASQHWITCHTGSSRGTRLFPRKKLHDLEQHSVVLLIHLDLARLSIGWIPSSTEVLLLVDLYFLGIRQRGQSPPSYQSAMGQCHMFCAMIL